jgi:hypothetical protein
MSGDNKLTGSCKPAKIRRHTTCRDYFQSNLLDAPGTKVTCGRLLPRFQPAMVRTGRSDKQEMLSPTNHETGRCAHWCATVVLLAICALTISVATRYGSPQSSDLLSTHTVHKHCSPEPGRQRLTNNATNWIPPVVEAAVLQSPAGYARVAPAEPTLLKFFRESSLYNRPPPVL